MAIHGLELFRSSRLQAKTHKHCRLKDKEKDRNFLSFGGWDWANFHVTPAEPNEQPFTFKILFIWEKVNGEWICKGDIYVLGWFEAEPASH